MASDDAFYQNGELVHIAFINFPLDLAHHGLALTRLGLLQGLYGERGKLLDFLIDLG